MKSVKLKVKRVLKTMTSQQVAGTEEVDIIVSQVFNVGTCLYRYLVSGCLGKYWSRDNIGEPNRKILWSYPGVLGFSWHTFGSPRKEKLREKRGKGFVTIFLELWRTGRYVSVYKNKESVQKHQGVQMWYIRGGRQVVKVGFIQIFQPPRICITRGLLPISQIAESLNFIADFF